MSRIISFILAFFFVQQVNAQMVLPASFGYKADVKVFVVESTFKADLLVYVVNTTYKAKDNKGRWYFTNAKY